MKEVNTPSQEESIVEREVDELAITRAIFTLSRAKFLMEEIKFNAQTQPIPGRRDEPTSHLYSTSI